MTEPSHAVFLSHASQDAEPAQKICEALRAAGIEVWFDQSALRGGDVWDQTIRKQIKTCVLFMPVISGHTHERDEGYFRLEWKLAVDRSHLMTSDKAFLLPVVIDDTREDDENVPDRFKDIHWTRLPAGKTPPAFVERVRRLMSPEPAHASTATVPPAGPVSTASPPIKERLPASSRTKWVVSAIAAVVVAGTLGHFAIDRFWVSKHAVSSAVSTAVSARPQRAAVPEKSIAVLPFVDMSEKHDQEYFSDGLSEELIDLLTKVPGLRVPARTSSFFFKGKPEDIETIAQKLRVAHVLEGSVRKSANTIRVTAQLIQADNGYHLWSETYDRKLDDIFKVQDEIAGAVVSALKVSLADSSTLKVTTPKNTQAYTLYLQGRAINRSAVNKAQFDSAAEYMRKAIKADPTFAEAWAWLANVLANEVNYNNYVRGDAVAVEMRHATERALALDPNLSAAHGAKGMIYLTLEWDWEAGAAEAQKAYDLDPTDPSNAIVLGGLLWALHGASDTVLALFQKAIDLDPVASNGYVVIGQYYTGTGKLPEAETAIRKGIDLLPTDPSGHAALGTVLLLRGEVTAALAEFQRDPEESDQRLGAALAYFSLGRRAEANAALSEMERLDATTHASNIAEALSYRGGIDQAFAWLDRAYQQHDGGIIYINRDPLMKSLHGDRRWKAFLRKMKLPE